MKRTESERNIMSRDFFGEPIKVEITRYSLSQSMYLIVINGGRGFGTSEKVE